MDILEAKKLVVEAGKQLVSSGLIARTWGNVSCRIDSESFVITPSGRAYESLTPDEIVLVKIADLAWEGDVKPSSEKGVHAQCYALRPECNFVIHTHQMNASVVSAIGNDIHKLSDESRALIGSCVPVASYGMPGTGKLINGVKAAIAGTDSKAIVMAHHGAVCLGKDYEEAFAIASELENVCEQYIMRRYTTLTDKTAENLHSLNEYAVNLIKRGKADAPAAKINCYDSVRSGGSLVVSDKEGVEKAEIALKDGRLISGDKYPYEADIYRAIYNQREDINCIIHSDLPDVVAVSKIGKTMKPLLDDFAQIVGVAVKNAEFSILETEKSGKKIAKKLKKGTNAVLIKDNGAVCCGKDLDDAQAAEMVMDKGCKTELYANLFEKPKKISALDSKLMNVIYRLKYSKQK
ncbi:MAG: class II aldolase/adducin family protein [Clostridia bacterium]|nr:class II aldolase/adducin family protein [Clostridia bacterium]